MRATISWLLNDWLDLPSLTARERFAEHSRDTFESVLDVCERLVRDKFAPCNRLLDVEEPRFDGTRVHLPAAVPAALTAYAEAGLLLTNQDAALGGMQLPTSIEVACSAMVSQANIAIGAYIMLTRGNANTLLAHGTPAQIAAFAKPQLEGRFFGTMCLSEPQAGSSLSDIATRAVPDGDGAADDPLGPRFRLKGNKMWISGGEHEMGENIVHLVLAKIPGPDGRLPPGVRGISLFAVPRKLVRADGSVTSRRNDVSLAGLNHKCGYRGTVNTLLNFGEGRFPVTPADADGVGCGDGIGGTGAGAIGYLVGEAGKGLACMFTLMNEARIAVGMGAAMLGCAGYEASLDYARNRPQGRPVGPGGKDATQPQVPIVQHADVKRMLLAQKSYCEGALALGLYCARLVDEQHTGTPDAADEARVLLEVLTPVIKSWPSEWCLEANSLAIQVLGGYGYTRDFPVEQHWRDNRLNMIHEGTHGIQGMDLLGRKVVMDDGRGLRLLARRMQATIERAGPSARLGEFAQALERALGRVAQVTQAAWQGGNPQRTLANATPYLQAFGHTVLAWTWLDVAVAAERSLLAAGAEVGAEAADALRGRLAAAQYFFRYELPKTEPWLAVVERRDDTCLSTDPAWL